LHVRKGWLMKRWQAIAAIALAVIAAGERWHEADSQAAEARAAARKH